MADTTVHQTLEVKTWNNKFHVEYVRSNEYAPYMGRSEFSPIVYEEKLTSERGVQVVVNLVASLSNNEVLGSNPMTGNEEKLLTYGHTITCTLRRNAVDVHEEDQDKSSIQLLQAARPGLMTWRMDKTRANINTALGSIDGVAYASASTAQKDAWNVQQSDRVLYGAATSNYNATHATALANVDASADTLSGEIGNLAKRRAKVASPAIRPFRVKDDMRQEWFIMFCPSPAFRDFQADVKDNPSARPASSFYVAGQSHPLVRDGDIVLGGIIYREVPSIGVISGVGAAGIDVAPCYLVGAQAIGYGLKKRTTAIRETRDYGSVTGIGIKESSGIEKMQTNFDGVGLKDHGVSTIFVAGVGD